MTPSHSLPSDRLEASLAGFDVPAARPPDFPTADERRARSGLLSRQVTLR